MSDDNITTIKSKLELSRLVTETNICDDLFQSIQKSLTISPFVVDVLNGHFDKAIGELIWHFNHKAIAFEQYLQSSICTQLLNKKKIFDSSNNLIMDDFKLKFHSQASMMQWLRETRRTHACAIAILELQNQICIEESMARMSFLAETLTQIAYQWSVAYQQLTFGLAYNHNDRPLKQQQNMLILAMGKFGGHELNFSSDIDLIFFFSSMGKTQGGRRCIDNSLFFQKVGVLLIKLLDEITQDGFVFRVDMRLRPYGDSGNLVMSIDQAEDYYQEQGRGWERFAMVRARIITGRDNEKRQLESILTPFAFRRYIDYGVIDSLRNMKEMIQREVRRKGLKGDIKLGAGGIREIEFMVQSLQLIQGGRDKRLQEKNVLKVIPLLTEVNLLPTKTSSELAHHYRFLRRLEHCLQELDEKQTQELPQDKPTQRIIAAVMGFKEWALFKKSLNQLQKNTNEHFSALFGEDINQNTSLDEFYCSLWEGHITTEQLTKKINRFDNTFAIDFIETLEKFKHSSLVNNLSARGAKRLKLFFPSLLEIVLKINQPVQTLERLVLVLRSILKRTAYLELLSENLPILQHLVDLVSRSDWIVQRLSECPILLDELLYPNSLYEPLMASDLHSELQQNLLRVDDCDEEQVLDTVRTFKQINELRVAAALLSQRLSISQVSRYLTELAQVIIQIGIQKCWQILTRRYGTPENLGLNETGFCVIAYGKLGGFELGFNSDLDLVFLFDQPLDTHTDSADENLKTIGISRFYTRLAQKIIHFLSTRTHLGVLYEVDMRLRPSGNSGLLVSHINAFNDYQNNSAWTWEHQALTRARAIAGDQSLKLKFEKTRQTVLELNREQERLKSDVLNMRIKMRQELDKSSGENIDLKQCQGGLVDIEFLAQYLILNLNQTTEKLIVSIISTNTIEMLKWAESHYQIEKNEMLMLIKIYRKYQNYLNERALVSGNELIEMSLFENEFKSVLAIWESVFELNSQHKN